MKVRIILNLLTLAIICTCSTAAGTNRHFLPGFINDTDVKFKAKDAKLEYHFSEKYWYEKNERNTSIHYNLWNRTDVHFLEWPGNFTELNRNYPLLKWKKGRAKFIQNVCSKDHLGIQMIAYAYKYVHLTWGPHRITQSYCPPLSVPVSLLKTVYKKSTLINLTSIPVVDIAFVLDALLVATEYGVIRVSGLEMAFEIKETSYQRPLAYSMATGLTLPIDTLVTQSCCSLSNWCPNGDTVLAYSKASTKTTVFLSYDGGVAFESLNISLPSTSKMLHTAIVYPEQHALIVVHGGKSWGMTDKFSNSGKLVKSKDNTNFTFNGDLQMSRIGVEQSFLIWDMCKIWYSHDGETALVKALVYEHKNVYPNQYVKNKFHRIKHQHCFLGQNSTLAFDATGKLGFLDVNNVLLFGIDSKMPLLQLVAMKTDISLLLPNKILSIVPYFDQNNLPKMLYPPRYLHFPDLGSVTKNYSQRAAMKLVIKTFFPWEFMTVFYEEQEQLSDKKNVHPLKRCMTTSISLNNSITQKPKIVTVAADENVGFYLTFKSKSSATNQLLFEPKAILKFFDITIRLESTTPMGLDEEYHWFKYKVAIKSRSKLTHRKVFLINFFTSKGLRCNYQPQQPVWIVRSTQIPETNVFEEQIPTFSSSHGPETGTKPLEQSCKIKTKSCCSGCEKSDDSMIAQIRLEMYRKEKGEYDYRHAVNKMGK